MGDFSDCWGFAVMGSWTNGQSTTLSTAEADGNVVDSLVLQVFGLKQMY